jgi:hypothetical protein
MATSKGKLDTVYPALLMILNNVAPHIKRISPSASSKVIQLFSSMSTPSFLLANETNHTLLAALLDFINAILEHNFTGMPSCIIFFFHICVNSSNDPRKLVPCLCNFEVQAAL